MPPTTSGLETERVHILEGKTEEEIEKKVRCIKKEEGKIQLGKVSKKNNMNKEHAHIYSAEINK